MSVSLQSPVLWSTNLFIPAYREVITGSWKILLGKGVIHNWGYFSGPCLVQQPPVLMRKSLKTGDWQTWITLTPKEIESQELACRYASGHTVIMGLGMGWVTANAALNPRVTQVTIIEPDDQVSELFFHSGAYESIPEEARQKITVINESHLLWKTDRMVDFLYVDSPLEKAPSEKVKMMQDIQNNVKSHILYFRGQEICLWTAAKNCYTEPLTFGIIRETAELHLNLPLLIPEEVEYTSLVKKAVLNIDEKTNKDPVPDIH